MSTLGFIEYEQASADVRAVYDDIKATRKIDKVTNFWKALAHDPIRLKRTWEDTKTIMAAGARRDLGGRRAARDRRVAHGNSPGDPGHRSGGSPRAHPSAAAG